MNIQVVYAILSLLERGAAAAKAMQGAADVIRHKTERGEEVTLDDLKQYEIADDKARDALVEAIEEAEQRDG